MTPNTLDRLIPGEVVAFMLDREDRIEELEEMIADRERRLIELAEQIRELEENGKAT